MGKLLVANRGEIAVRIFRTCHRLGVETVGVAAPDDAGALHVRVAGEVRAVSSYLSARDVVEAALDAGADAIHPGYGFLAESGDFAQAVEDAGLLWVGPPPEALRALGDKLEAKRLAAAAGVPLLASGSPEELGFPLLVKATAGGGGRGMRIVRSPADLDRALGSARREAGAAFEKDDVFLERYLERPRHVEIQLLADGTGTCIHLGERDCSLQRRHQKVLEESPAPGLADGLRSRLADAALALAQAVGYASAGTAEFLVTGEEFFFLELNARIQVEHPVTELVTGVDLVEEQLRIAVGEPLRSSGLEPNGHAVEARLLAEHPLTFLPQIGRVERLELPSSVRVDAGVEAGDDVPLAYDGLLAKLIARGGTRAEALDALAGALAGTAVGGVTTNLPFLRWLVAHPELRGGAVTTAFLAEYPPLSSYPKLNRPWSGFWRLNRDPGAPPPPRAAAPRLEDVARAPEARRAGESSVVTAPLPGTVIRVLAAEGERVGAREPLLVIEAMKMETPLVSPYDAVVRRVYAREGDRIAAGAALVELEA